MKALSAARRRCVLRSMVGAYDGARHLNVHEHIGIETFQRYGITTPRAQVVTSPAEAEALYAGPELGGEEADCVIKAQILAGGRGRGTFTNGFEGGVHMITEPGQASEFAEAMLGNRLVTNQSGEEGKPVEKLLMAERVYMRREKYISILMDRGHNGPVIVASPEGGMSIEDVAAATPEKIFTEPIDITTGPSPEVVDRLATNMGFRGKAFEEAQKLIPELYTMFMDLDCTLIEVNPLAELPDGQVMVCDAKINFDDNAEFRQTEMFKQRDFAQEDPREVEAAKVDLNYIGLDGSIGCMVNGAGLAMATLDIIKLYGGSPANFLDVGGGATSDQVKVAFELLNDDASVNAVLVNIFGGIMRCDVIAKGIIDAAAEINLKKPIVVRLQGTNVEQANAMIEAAPFRMILADDLDDAAEKAVRIADIVEQAKQIDVGVTFELPL
jgi:succinyl-CoA synthetase beta subunit